jgi:DNA-binding NarL/FixJ family response regulator
VWSFIELTDGERRIAVLAAQGVNIRTIAEQMGVTSGTVHRYLANVYRKLDISGPEGLTLVSSRGAASDAE